MLIGHLSTGFNGKLKKRKCSSNNKRHKRQATVESASVEKRILFSERIISKWAIHSQQFTSTKQTSSWIEKLLEVKMQISSNLELARNRKRL